MLKFLLIVALVAVAVYLLIRVLERRGLQPPEGTTGRGPIGPDDDPDFLWRLNRNLKKRGKDDPESS